MNQTTTPGAARSAILWNRLRTFLSKPHNVILLLMGIVVTITTIAPIVAIVEDTFKIHPGTIDAHLTGQTAGYTLVNYIDLFTSTLAKTNLWTPLLLSLIHILHEDLVQSLKGQIALVLLGGGAVGLRPVLGDEGVQNAGLDHLGLDLVAVLDQGHGKGAGVLQGVGGELIEDLVVLGLLPLELHGVAWVDGLQILDEQGQGTLAAAGVAHAQEGLAVGLLDGCLLYTSRCV